MSLATLAEIGIKALRLQDAIDKRRAARIKLRDAYSAYRNRHGNGTYFDKTSRLYAMMMTATDSEHGALQLAQHEVTAAQRGLERACRKAQRELAAGVAAEGIVRRAMESAS